ncbi:hypothetical protein DBIPINDM_006824 [Mesorhizobium sp. AR02]|uniref:hypothetical protein n=1 Tax=Mesorhizobium sp. AR02 TaxID=2865837 RepID=UPI002160FF77|nr:hypothetical protein [Mesorhizobium sp. AR02]UVK53341.1 hypothetical protein DBIPINDM_006824 [Mesorhizobium sp. AR02]
MNVLKFIAEILLGTGRLEPDGFHAGASEQRTGGLKPPGKKVPGCSKELDGAGEIASQAFGSR